MTAWLEGTALSTWMRESSSIWAYPTILTLHTVGLAIVVGASAVIDFRILGFAPRIPVPSLSPLFGIILWAFLLNAATGLMLFAQDAMTKSGQPVFYIKLTLIALALGIIMVIRRGLRREPERFRSEIVPGGYRMLAVLSLLLWAGAITAGRLMAYL